jgi:hypothetical protein
VHLTRWGSPAGGALAEAGATDERADRRTARAGHGRGALAPIVLALSTVAGVVAAVLALAPAALRGGPAGERSSPASDEVEEQALPR